MVLQRDEKKLGFTIVAEPGLAVDFKVYQIQGYDESGKVCWIRNGWTSLPDPVETLAEAQVWLSGSVLANGCCNWQFQEEPVHFCERNDLLEVGELLALCWDWAFELTGWHKPS